MTDHAMEKWAAMGEIASASDFAQGRQSWGGAGARPQYFARGPIH